MTKKQGITTPVPLQCGESIQVRRLGMFELDDVPRDIPGPYTVTILFANGEVYEQALDLTVPRQRPTKPLEFCTEQDIEYYDWQDYLSWQQGLLHLQKQHEAYCNYLERIAAYIRQNCILTDIDHNLITSDDWPHIYQSALCPQVTMEDIAAAMRNSFQLPV